MLVYSDQADPNLKHVRMTCRSFAKLTLDLYGIDDSIDTQMMEKNKFF